MVCRLGPSGIGAIVRLCLADEKSECREVSCARPQSPKVALNQSRELYLRLLSDMTHEVRPALGLGCSCWEVCLKQHWKLEATGATSPVAQTLSTPRRSHIPLGSAPCPHTTCHAPCFMLLVYDLLHFAIASFNKSTKQRKQWMKLIL